LSGIATIIAQNSEVCQSMLRADSEISGIEFQRGWILLSQGGCAGEIERREG